MNGCVCVCVHVYTCACVYVYTCVCVYVYTCACVHVYACVYVWRTQTIQQCVSIINWLISMISGVYKVMMSIY